MAALQQTKTEAPKKKRAADDSASAVRPKKQKAAAAMPTEIIDELVAIRKIPYDKQEEAKLKRTRKAALAIFEKGWRPFRTR